MLRGQDDESQEAKRPRRRETRGQEAKKIRDKRSRVQEDERQEAKRPRRLETRD